MAKRTKEDQKKYLTSCIKKLMSVGYLNPDDVRKFSKGLSGAIPQLNITVKDIRKRVDPEGKYPDIIEKCGEGRSTFYRIPNKRKSESWMFEVALKQLSATNASDPEDKIKDLPPVDNFVDKFETEKEKFCRETKTEKINPRVIPYLEGKLKVTERDKQRAAIFLHLVKNLLQENGETFLNDNQYHLATLPRSGSSKDIDKHLFIWQKYGKLKKIDALVEKDKGCLLVGITKESAEKAIQRIVDKIKDSTPDGKRWKDHAIILIKQLNPLGKTDSLVTEEQTIQLPEQLEKVVEKIKIQKEIIPLEKEDISKVIFNLEDSENSIESICNKTGLSENKVKVVMLYLIDQGILDKNYKNLAYEDDSTFKKLEELQKEYKIEKEIRKRNVTIISRNRSTTLDQYLSDNMKKTRTQLGQLNNGLYVYNTVIDLDDEKDLESIGIILIRQEPNEGEQVVLPEELVKMFQVTDQRKFFIDFIREKGYRI